MTKAKSNLMNKMCTMAALVVSAWTASAAGPITPTTQWGDIIPTNTLQDVARGAELATSNDVANATNDLARIAHTGSYDDLSDIPAKRIAMFVVDVNYRLLGNTSTATNSQMPYLAFELKASTNNFAASDDDLKLQFYSHSDVANSGDPMGDPVMDRMRLYTCSHYDNLDYRAYKYIGNTFPTNWPYKLSRVVVLVDAGCLVRNPGGDWLREDNEDLVWCYVRNLDNSLEYEPGTDKAWWKPIAPVRWFSRMPNWAEQLQR